MEDGELIEKKEVHMRANKELGSSELQDGELDADLEMCHVRVSELSLLCRPEDINQLVCRVDPDGMYRYLNPSYGRILGDEPSDLEGEHLWARFHPDDLTRVKTEYSEAIQSRSNRETECRYRHSDGRYV